MTKTITLILVALFSVACGGEPFAGEAETLAGAGGDAAAEAGAVGLSSGGSDAQAGGSSSAAGRPAGGSVHVGGSSGSSGGAAGAAGDSGAAGAAGGAPPVTCAFDVTQLTAALPTTITWSDFAYTEGALCVMCRDKPCGGIHVISWGIPQLLEDGRYLYLPNAEMPMISVNFGANDGVCAKSTECGIKMSVSSLTVTVAQRDGTWFISKAEAGTGAQDNQCLSSAGFSNSYPAVADLKSETDASLLGLKIPCR